jgi:6-phosphogluconolactonase
MLIKRRMTFAFLKGIADASTLSLAESPLHKPEMRRMMAIMCRITLHRIIGFSLFIAFTTAVHSVPVFIGTGGGKNSGAKGIYRADFNPESGALTTPELAAEYTNPGFLAQHPSKPVLLSIGAPKQAFADGGSSVAAFAIGDHHRLSFLGESPAGGKGACHLAIDATGGTVAVANYGDGTIATLRLDENGVPKEIVSVIANRGSGPNKSRQEGPHAHGVYFDRANQHLFVPDLGLDKVHVYPFDASTSKLGEPLPPLETAPGAGPRHMAFSPDGKHAYVLNELDCSILVASHEAGRLKAIGAVPVLLDPPASSTAAEIEVSADGKFVYASIRARGDATSIILKDKDGRAMRRDVDAGERGNQIHVFKRDATDGKLGFVDSVFCGGRIPRHFAIAPGGKWLLCGHQDSNTISLLPLDPVTGKPGEPAHTVACPSPICILFAR